MGTMLFMGAVLEIPAIEAIWLTDVGSCLALYSVAGECDFERTLLLFFLVWFPLSFSKYKIIVPSPLS